MGRIVTLTCQQMIFWREGELPRLSNFIRRNLNFFRDQEDVWEATYEMCFLHLYQRPFAPSLNASTTSVSDLVSDRSILSIFQKSFFDEQ